eukprot:CAMPEP_0117450634 /NCGR_PEP_ID=MMETSP0759-20121206/8575_1 /TAXON_ID=63605 /ORGANISM="Percolomonas cosmopolitus, Strain WS" /LENGTH=1174 /DNA_ID=CAMNT_0005243173 /DNA_START=384 /DNA_END=3908 /DNA_ORIENTATION=+
MAKEVGGMAFFTEENTNVKYRIAEWEKSLRQQGVSDQQVDDDGHSSPAHDNGHHHTTSTPTSQQMMPSIALQGALRSATQQNSPTTPSSPRSQEWFISHEQKKMRKLQRDLESLQHDRFLMQEEIYKVRNEMVMWRTKYEQLEHTKPSNALDSPAFQKIELQNDNLTKDIEKLKFQLDENKREVYESKLHVERLRDQLDEARAELLAESDSKRTLNLQLEELRMMHVELQEEKKRMEDDLPEEVPDDYNEKQHYTAHLHNLQDQLFVLSKRNELISKVNERIHCQGGPDGQSSVSTPQKAHQGHCALMCFALDHHHELWRDLGVRFMSEYVMEVYTCLERLISDYNGYISHMTENEELIFSFDNVYDSVEFSLALRDELINTLSAKSEFDHLPYCPTVVDPNDSKVLLFKGVRYLSHVHVDYPQVRTETIAIGGDNGQCLQERADEESAKQDTTITPTHFPKQSPKHDIYYGELITDLQSLCRQQVLPGFLNLSLDAWQEVSHLSLETSFSKSPLEIHETTTKDAVLTCMFPRVLAEGIHHIIPRTPTQGVPARTRMRIHQEMKRVQKQMDVASAHLLRIEEEELAREEELRQNLDAASTNETHNVQSRLLQLVSKFDNPQTLWNQLKPELDELTDQLVEQSQRVQELESVKDTLSPSKLRHLQQLTIQLERTQVRHAQIKSLMESMTLQDDKLTHSQEEIHTLEEQIQKCNAEIDKYKQKLEDKSDDLQQTTAEVARLQTEIALLVDREKTILSSEASPTREEDERRLFKKLQLLTRKAEAVLSMDESLPSNNNGDAKAFASHKRRDLKDFLKQSLQIQLEKSRTKCEQLKSEVDELRQRLKQVSELSEKSVQDYQDLETQLVVANKKIIFMEQQMKRKNEEIDGLKTKIDSLEYILVVAEKKQKVKAHKMNKSSPLSPRGGLGSSPLTPRGFGKSGAHNDAEITHSPKSPSSSPNASSTTTPPPSSPSPHNSPSGRLASLPPIDTNRSVLTDDFRTEHSANSVALTQLVHSSNDSITFDPKTKDTSFELQNDFQSVVYKNDHVYRTILGNMCWTNGKHSFTVHLDRASDNILIGVADMFHTSDRRAGETTQSWAISINTGSIFHSGGWKRYANRRIEKYIVVEVDLSRAFEGKGTISFILDGFSFGVAARNLRGALSPVVSMYHKGDQISIV